MSVNKKTSANQGLPFGRGGPGRGRFRPVEKATNTRGTLIRLWNYLKQEQVLLVTVFVLILITTLLNLAGPYLMGQAIDQALQAGDRAYLLRLALSMAAVYLGSALFTWLRSYVMVGASQRTIRLMRQELFTKIQTLSISFFDRHAHGELMSRLTNDIDNISNTLTTSFTQLITSLLSVIGVSIMMLSLNWRLASVCLLVIPLVVFGITPIIKRTRKGYALQQKKLGEINGLIEESVSGQKVVKLYCQEEAVLQEFQKTNQELTQASIKAQIMAGIMGPLMNVINNANFALVVSAGGLMSIYGLATVGTIASFTSYVRQFSRPLNHIASLFNTLQSALAGAERVFEIMDQEVEVKDKSTALDLHSVTGKVEFKNVNFSYLPGQPVLKDINLVAQPGQMVALVGPTGAGKTTIVNLLTRFYDIDSGRIEVDGRDIRDLKKESLRRKLGIVLQDSYLFSGTVLEAIAYGNPTASRSEIEQAAQLANADTFIHRLLDGYDTLLASKGANISQGQRQLLTIARAALANPSILILDEATSSVDTRTEVMIQQAMLKIMKNRTSFVIAHRLSTIRNADCILVINNGEIIERGTHEELLNKNGLYSNLYHNQFANGMGLPSRSKTN